MTDILAIDPGPTHSGWVVIDSETMRPIDFDKDDNKHLADLIAVGEFNGSRLAIEMVASYGMPVGAEVFETCVWIGRFLEMFEDVGEADRVYRKDIKLHLCGTTTAKDANIRQALVDRFAPGQKNHGKGTKDEPGWFHGFHSDIWSAYAIAVYAADQEVPF